MALVTSSPNDTRTPSAHEVSAAGMAERSGFVELTEYHPGEKGHGESTWISVRHVLRVKMMHEFASDHVYTQLIFASGGHDNYYFVDVIERPELAVALMQEVGS